MRLRWVAAIVVSVALIGCGAAEKKVSPRDAVGEAVKETADQKEGTFTLSVVGAEGDLNAVFNAGAPLTEEDRHGLDILRNGHIALSTGPDKFGLDVKARDLEHAFELRYVDKKLYARADIAGLAKLFGGSPEEINETLSGLASQEGFEFLAAAVAGQWIVADLSTMSGLFGDLGKQFLGEAGAGESIPVPTTDGQAAVSQFQALQDALGQAFSENVTVEELESDSTGDHYRATMGSLRTFYARVRPVLEEHLGNMASFGKLPAGLPAVSDVPDKPGNLDVWIKSGRVSRLELDLAQFASAPPAGAGRVALRLDIARDAAAVTAPADAVAVDLAALAQKFLSQFGSLLEGMSDGMAEYD